MKLLRGIYEGPGSHGSLRITAGMKDVHAVLRGLPGEGYFPALFGALAREGKPAPVSLSPIRKASEGSRVSRGPIGPGRDLGEVVRRYPDTGAILFVRSDAALSSGEGLPDLTLPRSPRTAQEVKLVTCEWEETGMGEHEAADLALESLVKAHATAGEKSPRPTVNLFGPPIFSPGAAAEMEEAGRLLELIGVDVNARLPLGAGVEDLSRLHRAWANVLLYREVGDAATLYLQNEFGTPRVTTPMIGSAGTGAVLRSVGELCSIDADEVQKLVWSELSHTAELPWYARLASPEAIRGKRVAIFGDFTYAIGLGYTLAREVGLEVVACGTYLKHLEQDFFFQANTFTDEAFTADDPDEVASRLENSKPDVIIGTYLEEEVADSLGVPFLLLCPPVVRPRFVEQPLMGYAGSASLADSLDGALRRIGRREHKPPELPWDGEALENLEKIPAPLRSRTRRLAEERARHLGSREVSREILEESRL